MFVKENATIDIKVYYKKLVHKYTAYTEKEFDSIDISTQDKEEFKVVNLKMREMTWGLYNELQDKAMIEDGSGNRHFNFKLYKENRLIKLIKEWDAKRDDGKPVLVNQNMISHLAPSIAEAILRAYDDVSVLNKEMEGNL